MHTNLKLKNLQILTSHQEMECLPASKFLINTINKRFDTIL